MDPFYALQSLNSMPQMGQTGSLMDMQLQLQTQIGQQMQQMFAIMMKVAPPAGAGAGVPAAGGPQLFTTPQEALAFYTQTFGATDQPWNGAPAAGGAAPPLTGGAHAPPAAPGTAPAAQRFMDIAVAQTGKPYVFGAAGPSKFDCSGLVHWSLNQAGVKGPRLTARGYQAKYANQKVDRKDLKPGDLLFFWSPNDRGIPKGQATHIEIYLGNGKSMGTDNPSEGARTENVNWDTFIGGARVPELQH